jgi:hypothetical protein
VPRLALLALPLTLAACGTGGSNAGTQAADAGTTTTTSAPATRARVRIIAPTAAHTVGAQSLGRRLRAVVRVSGRAAAGQQLTLRGACGGLDCEGITFADVHGHWRTRLELFTPRGTRRVRLTVAYADARAGERPAAVTLRLRRMVVAPPPAPPTPTVPSASPGTTADGGTPYTGARTMIVIGDSLAVGMAQPLRTDLTGWEVSVDGRIGRPLDEGMQILADTPLPSGSRGAHAILAFSLFTNDSPTAVDALEAAVRRSVGRLGVHGCAIWATIARPPYQGISYRAANQRLRALASDPSLAGRLLLVPWQEGYASHASWRAGDGVHATATGYAARAQMYADAARSCAA